MNSNICVLTENYGKGYTGAMTSTYELINRWVKAGINVTVLTTNIVGPVNNSVQIIKFHNIFNIMKFLKKNNCFFRTKFIGYSDDHFGFLFKIFSIHYIHTYHGNWPENLLHDGIINFFKGCILINLYAMTIHSADYVGSVSKHATKFISKFNLNYKIIRNGINLQRKPIKSYIYLQNHLNIIMVGSVDKRKYYLLIKLMKRLPYGIKNKICIDIYGNICNNHIYNKLKHYNICFKGFHSFIPYKKYDLFLNTSKTENLSIATVEAIFSGIPVITFDVGGMSEIIRAKETGLIIPKYKLKQMSLLFVNIIMKGVAFSFNNSYILKYFNWDKASNEYIDLFRQIRRTQI